MLEDWAGQVRPTGKKQQGALPEECFCCSDNTRPRITAQPSSLPQCVWLFLSTASHSIARGLNNQALASGLRAPEGY